MATTYEPIATTTLANTSTTTVTFSSISNTYTDLILICFVGNNSGDGAGGMQIRYNNDSGSNYSWTYLVGNGTSAISGRNSNATYFDCSMPTNTTDYGVITTQVLNYSNTTTYKTSLVRGSSASKEVAAIVSLYRSTSAINRIDCIKADGNFKNGSTFTLYGIKAA